jgi:hypothetical protein
MFNHFSGVIVKNKNNLVSTILLGCLVSNVFALTTAMPTMSTSSFNSTSSPMREDAGARFIVFLLMLSAPLVSCLCVSACDYLWTKCNNGESYDSSETSSDTVPLLSAGNQNAAGNPNNFSFSNNPNGIYYNRLFNTFNDDVTLNDGVVSLPDVVLQCNR